MAAYLASGTISGEAARLFAVVLPAMLVPSLLGARLFHRFSDTGFRRVVLGLLAVSGAVLIATTLPKLL